MDSKPTAGGVQPGPPSGSPSGSLADLEPLRKRLMSSIAQHISLPLFDPGKEDRLRLEIYRYLDDKLRDENIALDDTIMNKWVDDMISGLPKNRVVTPPPPAQAVVWTVESLRAHVAPYIASHLGNALFEPGREAQLSEAVYILVQEKIRQDGITADENLRRDVMKTIATAMGIPLPSAMNETAAPPTKVTTPPPPSAPPAEEIKVPTKNKVETRPIAPGDAPRLSLTPDLRRAILLKIASQLDPGILGSGKPEAARSHVESLVANSIKDMNVELTPDERDEIIGTILSGEGVEFQL